LTQQFVGEGERPILVGQLSPRLEARRPPVQMIPSTIPIRTKSAAIQVGSEMSTRSARRADTLAFAQRLDNVFADQPGGPDH
jgi:hypothetical protein